MNPRVSIVVALDDFRGIGKDNGLLWNLSSDLKRFKEITTGHPIIMGRKTYESIGRPLPNRTNIVITRNSEFHPEGVVVVHDLDEAFEEAAKLNPEEIFVIGGGEIFNQVLPITERIYLTHVFGDFGAEIYFPEYAEFFTEFVPELTGEENGLRWEYGVIDRK